MPRYIDANRLLKDEFTPNGVITGSRDQQFDLATIRAKIFNSPTANVQEVKHGKWIKDVRKQRDDGEIYDYCCSLCRGAASKGEYGNYDIFTDFCPHCGTKMDLE